MTRTRSIQYEFKGQRAIAKWRAGSHKESPGLSPIKEQGAVEAHDFSHERTRRQNATRAQTSFQDSPDTVSSFLFTHSRPEISYQITKKAGLTYRTTFETLDCLAFIHDHYTPHPRALDVDNYHHDAIHGPGAGWIAVQLPKLW